MTRCSKRAGSVAVGAVLTLSSTSCGIGLDKLPLPAAGVTGDTYSITASFSNALNLPANAKVKLAGADVGEVESIAPHDYTAVVGMRIKTGTVLPVGTTAELRSATPLGDLFVAVKPPPNPPAAVLADGDDIPLQSTFAAATVEEVLTTASLLVNGGVLRNLTNITNGLGNAVGAKGDRLAGLINETTHLVQTLNARSGEITNAITQTSRLANQLSAQQSTIAEVLDAASPASGVLAENTQSIVGLVNQLNRITQQLQRFPSVAGTDNRSLVADLNSLSGALNDVALDPNTSLDVLNNLIGPGLKLTSGTALPVDAELKQLALGAVADMNHLADPGSRMPNRSDWHYLVGSLAYTLTRLHDRVWGPSP